MGEDCVCDEGMRAYRVTGGPDARRKHAAYAPTVPRLYLRAIFIRDANPILLA